MIPHVIEAAYLGDHRVWVRFDDGASGELDLSEELEGPIFEPLGDASYFGRFRVGGNTLCWENGADFAPEFLRDKLERAHHDGSGGKEEAPSDSLGGTPSES